MSITVLLTRKFSGALMDVRHPSSMLPCLKHQCLTLRYNALWSAIEQNDSRFSIIFISYFYEKDGGRWETYCLYGVEGDGILSIL